MSCVRHLPVSIVCCLHLITISQLQTCYLFVASISSLFPDRRHVICSLPLYHHCLPTTDVSLVCYFNLITVFQLLTLHLFVGYISSLSIVCWDVSSLSSDHSHVIRLLPFISSLSSDCRRAICLLPPSCLSLPTADISFLCCRHLSNIF